MASSVSDATRSGGSDVVAGAGSRPRIGITTYLEPARWGVWDQPATLLPHAYVEVLHRAGGVPVLLPPLPDGAADALIGVDGLLLAGGADVDPERYGAPPQEGTDRPRRDRDGWEFGLLAVALAQRMPVLGVCRGAQVLNVAAGGTLHQHLPDVLGHDGHRPALGRFGRVQVSIDPGSTLAEVLGPGLDVPCSHHQAIDRLGTGLRATARAADGTIEGVEGEGREYVVGVQWHPELDSTDLRLFGSLVAAARDRLPRTTSSRQTDGRPR